MVLNCGYGRGFSVLEVIEAVKRGTGTDFDAAGRARDGQVIRLALVAEVRRIAETLNWTPRYNDLDLIINHAHVWERGLITRHGEAIACDRS